MLTGLKRGSDDNHFLLKVYKLEPSSFGDYYLYHLDYYLSKDEQNSEEEFFKHVWRIVFKRIEYFESRDPFSSKHALYVANIEKLRAFQEFLAPRDKWNIRPNDALLREKDGQIADLLAKIEEQQRELKEYRNFDVVVKAMVQDGYLATFMDLIHQMRALKLPNGRKLLMDDHASPYYKLVSKYFAYEGKDIPINSARNYFVKKDPKDAKKGVKIEEHEKLFKIVPKDQE